MALSRYCGVSIFVSILFIFISPPLLVRPVSTTPLLLHESGLEPFGVAPAPPTAHAGATPNGRRVGALDALVGRDGVVLRCEQAEQNTYLHLLQLWSGALPNKVSW